MEHVRVLVIHLKELDHTWITVIVSQLLSVLQPLALQMHVLQTAPDLYLL